VLQQQRWQAVERFLENPKIDIALPEPGLTEVIFKARARGNVTAPNDLVATISTNRIQIMPNQAPDYVRAAELLEISQANPGPTPPGASRPSTLSLGDSLILAFAERMGSSVLSRDRYWGWLKGEGVLDLNIQTF
jgi:hypothetical protein